MFVLFLLKKSNIISKEKILKIFYKIKEKLNTEDQEKEEDIVFKELEKLNLPITFKSKRQKNKKISIPNWAVTGMGLGVKLFQKFMEGRNDEKSDQNDEKLIRSILEELDKL